MLHHPQKHRSPKRILISALIVGIVVLLLSIGIWTTLLPSSNTRPNGTHGVQTPNQTSGIPINKGSVSPLLFGTNMSLFDSNDQIVNSATTQSQLQQMHVGIIRMPVRSSLSNDTELRAAEAIKSVGARALVVLRGAVDANVLADDMRIIQDMNSIFGKDIVFYEYGNEEDLLGIDVNAYTASWNAIIPRLKQVALQGKFIGPVNFRYDQAYLANFLQQAHPRPDAVSWHEYTCDDAEPDETCISRIDHWTTHIRNARTAMIATIATALPILITEWNYAPNATSNDGKNNDSIFMQVWTTRALETLAANRIFASMQYACTNASVPLITHNDTLTTQGMIFQTLYQRMIVKGQQPAPISTSDLQ